MKQIKSCLKVPGPTHALFLSSLLNSVFDIYGDGMVAYDINYKNHEWNAELKRLSHVVKQKWKSMKIHEGGDCENGKVKGDRQQVCESWENLNAFVKYKDQEVE